MKAGELARRLKLPNPPTVIDVRGDYEYKGGHIPGAIHAPNWKIIFKIAKLPDDKTAELVVTCEQGPRAQMAYKILTAFGYRNVTLLDGHMLQWRKAARVIEK